MSRRLARIIPIASYHSVGRAARTSLANILSSERSIPTLVDHTDATERVRLKRFFEDRLPFEEHVRELAELKLAGTPHDADSFAATLADRRDIHVLFRPSPGPLAHGASTSETIQYHGDDRYTVRLREGLSWWYKEYVSFHALGHVTAGHLFAERDADSADITGVVREHRKRLARKPPLTPNSDPVLFPDGYSPSSLSDLLLLYEVEADLRARYYMRTAKLGAAALELDRLNQLT